MDLGNLMNLGKKMLGDLGKDAAMQTAVGKVSDFVGNLFKQHGVASEHTKGVQDNLASIIKNVLGNAFDGKKVDASSISGLVDGNLAQSLTKALGSAKDSEGLVKSLNDKLNGIDVKALQILLGGKAGNVDLAGILNAVKSMLGNMAKH